MPASLGPGGVRPDTTRRTRVLRVIWSAQLAALFLFGGIVLLRQLQAALPSVAGPWGTTDRWLQRLELVRPSETIRSALDGIEAGALLFVGRDDEPTTILTYYTVSYLLWPRPVGLCLSRTGIATQRAIVRTESVPVAAMYYDVESPTAGLRPTMLGGRLALVALSEPNP